MHRFSPNIKKDNVDLRAFVCGNIDNSDEHDLRDIYKQVWSDTFNKLCEFTYLSHGKIYNVDAYVPDPNGGQIVCNYFVDYNRSPMDELDRLCVHIRARFGTVDRFSTWNKIRDDFQNAKIEGDKITRGYHIDVSNVIYLCRWLLNGKFDSNYAESNALMDSKNLHYDTRKYDLIVNSDDGADSVKIKQLANGKLAISGLGDDAQTRFQDYLTSCKTSWFDSTKATATT